MEAIEAPHRPDCRRSRQPLDPVLRVRLDRIRGMNDGTNGAANIDVGLHEQEAWKGGAARVAVANDHKEVFVRSQDDPSQRRRSFHLLVIRCPKEAFIRGGDDIDSAPSKTRRYPAVDTFVDVEAQRHA